MTPLSEAALVFLISAAVCLAAGHLVVRLLARAQCMAPLRYDDCPPLQAYQGTKPPTPTMGGLLVLGGAALVAAAAGGLSRREGWLVLLTAAGLGLVGLVDDCLKFRGPNAVGIRAWPKLLAALAIGAALGIASATRSPGERATAIPWMHGTVELGWAWVPLAMFVVAGCAHAVNLADGMDGLAAGCAAIVLATLGLWSMRGDLGDRALMLWCASLAGACVGFLWFNSFPASVFLGDVGALGLGGAIAAIGLLTRSAFWLPVIGGVFAAEAMSVILQVASYKWRGKRRLFRVAPLHHHVHLGGMSEPKVIVRFWIIGVILAMLGLAAMAVP